MTEETHKARQRADGSIYCYCPELTDQTQTASVSVNYALNKMVCSVCGQEVTE